MGYVIVGVIGFIAMAAGMFIMRSTIFEFTSGSKEKNLYEKWLHTRRVGACIALEGFFICGLTAFCWTKENSLLLYILLPISVVVCGIILYFIFKNNPMKK